MRTVAVLLAAVILALVVATFLGALQGAPYGAHNRGGDGTAHLFDNAGAVQVRHGPLAGLDPGGDAVLIVAPQQAYRERDVERLRGFLEAGGRVLVADTDQAGRHLVARLDVGLQITPGPVYSTSFRSDPLSPVVTSTTAIGGLPEVVELPRTHAVEGGGSAVLTTHELSWIDLDHDGRPGLTEPQGAFAVARWLEVGRGGLVAAGFPALFQARALDADQERTRDALLDWLRGDDDRTVVIHEGNRAVADPLDVRTLFTAPPGWPHAAALAAFALLVIAASVGIHLRRIRPPRRPDAGGKTDDPLTRSVLAELPDR